MYSCSDYLTDRLVNFIFGKEEFKPPTIFVGLSTKNPRNDASGLAEPKQQTGYARVQVSASHWSAASGGMLSNTTDIIFAEAKKSWGWITHFALFDSGGNMLIYGPLDRKKFINNAGDTQSFMAGDLTLGL